MNSELAMQWIGWLLLAASASYATLALLGLRTWHRRRRSTANAMTEITAVTVLKPLCGIEPRLYENLRSFCAQTHPQFQLVFGTREIDDPALAVARRLAAEFPQRDIVIVADPRVHGTNLKVSNVLNLLPAARHDSLVIADSDIAVPPDYLLRVTAPLAQAQVGLVTCLYRGRALDNPWARLGRQFIDDWFAPSVLVGRVVGARRFGFGATLALRRETLEAVGGLQALLPQLADDYRLAERIEALGLQTVLSDCEVLTDVTEQSLPELIAHELRWLRTIRLLQPLGYAFSFVTFTLPVALAGWALTEPGAAANGLLRFALIARVVLHYRGEHGAEILRRPSTLPEDFGLLLLRDALSLLLWALAFFGRRVSWRGQRLVVRADGRTQTFPIAPSESILR